MKSHVREAIIKKMMENYITTEDIEDGYMAVRFGKAGQDVIKQFLSDEVSLESVIMNDKLEYIVHAMSKNKDWEFCGKYGNLAEMVVGVNNEYKNRKNTDVETDSEVNNKQ